LTVEGVQRPIYWAIFDHIAHKKAITVNQRLNEFVSEAKLADRLGLDYYFTTEHHFSGDFSLSPSQAISLTVLAQVTERIRFGPLVVVLPLAEPLRLVEEMTIIDHMSNGRLELGLGRGIREHEHMSFGIAPETSEARVQEALEVINKAWSTEGRFSYIGTFHQYHEVELPWQPIQQPHPRFWMPTNTPVRAEELGRRGYGSGGFSFLGVDSCRPVAEAYERGFTESALEADDYRWIWMTPTVVAETDEEARDLCYQAFYDQIGLFEYECERTYEMIDESQHPRLDDSIERLRNMKEDLEGSDESLRFMCGSPETVIDKISYLLSALPANVFTSEFSFGQLEWNQVQTSMELLAEKVIPAFKRGI
jgi:alkanesulfonate monooxygenase SsuD/methylene tetrahydromethanopterin reductase-like flavin-dependent oxidoreductase (luciferase family)